MVSRFDVMDHRGAKEGLADISDRLRSLAREVKSLSQTQPDFRIRVESIRRDLTSIGRLLRGAQ